MCGARCHRNGKIRTSFSTTTMPRLTGLLKFRIFWPRTTWQWSSIPHTYSILPPVTFSSSPSWSFGWRVEDSTPLKGFKRNRSGYLTQFQKGTSRDVSKHGRNAGTAVFVQKGSNLKVMEEFNIQGKQTSFYKYCPGTFGYILVQLHSDIAESFFHLETLIYSDTVIVQIAAVHLEILIYKATVILQTGFVHL